MSKYLENSLNKKEVNDYSREAVEVNLVINKYVLNKYKADENEHETISVIYQSKKKVKEKYLAKVLITAANRKKGD